MDALFEQLIWLFVLALPVACVAWTIAHEEVFREPREWLEHRSKCAQWWCVRKICFGLTCDYCLSHYIAAAFVAVVDYALLLPDWRGYVIAWLAVVAVANVYLGGFARLRVEIRKEKIETKETETRIKKAG